MVKSDIKASQKLKNKGLLNIKKKYYEIWKNENASQIKTD